MTELERELGRYRKKVRAHREKLEEMEAGLREVKGTVDGLLIQLTLTKGEQTEEGWELELPRVDLARLLEGWQLATGVQGDRLLLRVRAKE